MINYAFDDAFIQAPVMIQIEAARRALLAVLVRVRDEMETDDIEYVIEGLWSFSTDELFGVSAEHIMRQNYTPKTLGGVFGRLHRYRDEWDDQTDRPKTFYMADAVVVMLNVIRYDLSGNINPGKYVTEMLDVAAYALDEDDAEAVDWFNNMFMREFFALRKSQ